MKNPLKYTCLLGGGAVRGFAYIGVFRAFEELNLEFDVIAGSSVGALFATLLAYGYKSYEIENISSKINFDLFKDFQFCFGKNFALSKGEIYINAINKIINKKLELEENNPVKFKDLEQPLVIITTDLKEFKTQEFSRNATPDFEIAEAIKVSCSMPGLMPPFEYNDKTLVDGDLQKGVPMWQLSDTLKNNKSRILEIRLEGEYSDKPSPISYINTIYSCVTKVVSDFIQKIYGKNDKYDYIEINTGDIFFADFNLSKDERKKLIETGYEQTMNYFKSYLPQKKKEIKKVYLEINKYLNKLKKGIKINNVEEVQLWLGDLFIILCEGKEIIEPEIYSTLMKFKNNLINSVTRNFLFYKKFKNNDILYMELNNLIKLINEQIADIELFLDFIK